MSAPRVPDRRFIFAALSAIAFVLALPPMPTSCAWIALFVPLLLARAIDGATARQGTICGAIFGLTVNVIVLSFVPTPIERFTNLPTIVAILAALLLAIAQSIPWMIALGLAPRAQARGLALIAALPVAVTLADLAPHLFSWTIVTPLARVPISLQLADVIGEHGVAALFTALAVVTLGGGVSKLAASVAFAALLGFGVIRSRAVESMREGSPRLTIGLVQHAVPPRERWDPGWAATIVERLGERSRDAQAAGAQLVIWPESAFPYVLGRDQRRDVAPFRIRPVSVSIDVLAGLLAEAAPLPGDLAPGLVPHLSYNAATIVHRDGTIAPIAAKLALLPFGESVPFGEEIPALRRIFARGQGERPGRDVVLLTTDTDPPARIGVLNCVEDTLPHIARRVALASPTLLANLTNDAWFDGTRENELHFLVAIPRAIELRRDLVRAVNTGVSAHVASTGEIVARTFGREATTLMVTPALLEGPPTFYARVGDGPLALFFCFAAIASGARQIGMRAAPCDEKRG